LRQFKLKRFRLVLLIPLALALTQLAGHFPLAVERFYAQGVYRVISGLIGRLLSLVPISISSLIVVAVPAACVALIACRIHRKVNRLRQVSGERRRPDALRRTSTLLALAGVLYFLFVILCGLNYHRLTFAQISGLEVRLSSAEELSELCAQLVQSANQLRGQLPEDENGVMQLTLSDYQLARQAQQLYPKAAELYPVMGGYVTRPKPVLFPVAMSYAQISGIYIPYLFESNVNADVVDFNLPATMMHEMSHFKGFMREDEANFLAFLACKYSGDPAFEYSGTMLALVYSTNALYSTDKDLYWEVMEPLAYNVRTDLTANNQYWARFEGPMAEVSTAMNDMYLRSNRQEKGVKSYGAMVDLLLAEFRAEKMA